MSARVPGAIIGQQQLSHTGVFEVCSVFNASVELVPTTT